jgi:hypothetical protein
MLGWLRRFWQAERAACSPVEVLFYTRQGCHLCDEAWQVVQRAQATYRLAVRQVDVDSDPDLQAAYGLMVPVVCINGRVRFHGRVNPILFERLLRAEATGR